MPMVLFNMFQNFLEGTAVISDRLYPDMENSSVVQIDCPEDIPTKPNNYWTDDGGTVWGYSDQGNGTCFICSVETNSESLEVPLFINDLRVEVLAAESFEELESLRSVRVPFSVRKIGKLAFAHCRNLEQVILGDGLERIGTCAFAFNPHLKKVVLSEGLQVIDESAFWGCGSLTHISLPSSLKVIGPRAFANSGLELLALPAGLEELSDSALLACVNERKAFCGQQTVLSVNEENKNFFIEGGILCQRMPNGEVRALRYGGATPNVHIPDSVTKVGDWLFYGVSGIQKLVLHDGLEPYDSCAFAVADAISHVVLKLREPFEGQTTIDLWFSHNHIGRIAFLEGFRQNQIDVNALLKASDRSILCIEDPYERGCAILGRLQNRIGLSSGIELMLRGVLDSGLQETVKVFAQRNWMHGFDQLEACGFLRKDNIERMIEWTCEAGNTQSTDYLLKKKRNYISQKFMDEYDI